MENKSKFLQKIKENDNFIITTHINSDGDGLGAEFALYIYLKHLCKQVRIINEDAPSEKYKFLGFNNLVDNNIVDSSNDVIIMLDCNEKQRIGDSLQHIFHNDKTLIRIDHHSNPDEISGSLSIIKENASSVCEILFLLLEEEIVDFDPSEKTAFVNCLYTGIIFDTNNFTNLNVSPTTFSVASELITLGASNSICYRNIFEDKPTKAIKLLGKTLSTLDEINDGKIVIYHTTKKMMKDCKTDMEATNGFTKEVRPNKARHVVIYLREIDENYYRVSLRSTQLNVQKIAQIFGGGGHKFASGFKVKMDLTSIKARLIKIIRSQTNEKYPQNKA